jgi:putative ABC transport system ATP-binding protein
VIYRERRVESYEIWELRRNITLLFQEPRLFTGTIREELLWPFGLKHSLEVKPGEKRLEEILEICGLNKSPDNPTETLSGGEKQRVCLARTLLMNPDIILLDEPTSALNRELAEKVVESIFKKYQDKTFIIVTHSEEILSRSDTVLEMKDGKLHKKGAGQ